MAKKLKIEPEIVIRAKFKDYLDTLPTDEERKDFVNELLKSAEKQIQQKIDEAEALFESIETKAKSIVSGAPSFVAPALCADPMAPIASAGVIAGTIGTVTMAKGEISNLTGQYSKLTGYVTEFGLPLPAPLTALEALISSATSALNIIPI